jgi:hypothetical protein
MCVYTRHAKYKTQFRAMFVTNCRVIMEQKLEVEAVTGAPGVSYHPVHCDKCGAEVGVMDAEEVYHFFSAIPGER